MAVLILTVIFIVSASCYVMTNPATSPKFSAFMIIGSIVGLFASQILLKIKSN